MSDGQKSQRLFFALWPDEGVRRLIAKRVHKLSYHESRPVAVENLHITLAFIGPVGSNLRDCMEAVAAQVVVEPFYLELVRLGHFNRTRVIWVGPERVPRQLNSLVEQLLKRLQTCGYCADPRPYQAHMTVFRKARHALEIMEIKPVRWNINGFCLVESVTRPEGVHYHVVKEYP